MTLPLEQVIGQKLLMAFEGERPPHDILQAIRNRRIGGVALYRALNVSSVAQVYDLTAALEQTARTAGLSPFIIAIDQEGGQLVGLGDETTPLPGNLALGATRSRELARRAGEVMGRELAAVGINVNYAPVADVNSNPQNPVIGTRSFGEEPALVAALTAEMVRGIQSAGVVATAKHFPGHGDTAEDSHYGTPTVPHSLERLQQVEFPPFEAAIEAGVRAIMTAHIAVPAVTGRSHLPATLSRVLLTDVLRGMLGYHGIIVTDAMTMQAIRQGDGLGLDAVCAVAAGADAFLFGPENDMNDQERVYNALLQAAERGLIPSDTVKASARRMLALRKWLEDLPPRPDLRVVGSAEHQEVADEIARHSITVVRNEAGLLPLRLSSEARVAVIVPDPQDLTPADTSSYVTPELAGALRNHHPYVDGFMVDHAPQENDIAALVDTVRDYDLTVVGTLNAYAQPAQAALVQALLALDVAVVPVALRMPYDLTAYPQARTFVASYSILRPSMDALAAALFGRQPWTGRLPVSIPGLHPVGAGIQWEV